MKSSKKVKKIKAWAITHGKGIYTYRGTVAITFDKMPAKHIALDMEVLGYKTHVVPVTITLPAPTKR